MKRSIILLLLFVCPVMASAQQDGPLSPGATENQPLATCLICTGATWDSTDNIMAADGQFSSVTLDPYLTCFQTTCYRSRYLTAYNFGFNVPANAVIEGITVDVLGLPDQNGTVRDCTIALRRDNLNNLFGNNMALNTPWNVNQPLHSYGGADDLWGLAWTPADVNSPDFGTYIKLQNTSPASHTVDIDAVYITVNYSIGMETFSVTSSPQAVTMNYDATQSSLHLTTLSSATTHIIVVDMTGRVCIAQDVAENSVNIDLSSLAPGVYTAVAEQGNEVVTKKFVK
jgi:hypothetical protein